MLCFVAKLIMMLYDWCVAIAWCCYRLSSSARVDKNGLPLKTIFDSSDLVESVAHNFHAPKHVAKGNKKSKVYCRSPRPEEVYKNLKMLQIERFLCWSARPLIKLCYFTGFQF